MKKEELCSSNSMHKTTYFLLNYYGMVHSQINKMYPSSTGIQNMYSMNYVIDHVAMMLLNRGLSGK